MQKYFNFDATFVRKPMPLLETWRDVVMNVILAEPITEAFKIQPCPVNALRDTHSYNETVWGIE